MLGRYSPTELCPHPQIFFFPLAVLGFELRTLCLQSGTLLLEPYYQPLYHSDFQCGSAKGNACAPVGIGTFIPSFSGALGIVARCKW
jgi:hypothetical protein